ncbi:MAG: TRAP transporter large permease [Gammaproteobacteria bacterium]|nr:TRAP transporter large permease [Gammaproteobacteria bacterium]
MNTATVIVAAALLFMSLPIFLVFGIGGAASAILTLNLPWSTLIQVAFGAVTKHVLVAVPLFIFAGMVMLRGGMAARLVNLAVALVGHWPGGLGIAMAIAMGFFAAFCGSILAAITAVGTIMMPKMIEQGYPKPFVIVLAASAGLLEALIPPSNAAILFSALTSVPVSHTFAAGVLPGIALLLMLVLLVVWRCRSMPAGRRAATSEVVRAAWRAAPALVTPVVILGGIYSGLMTPSETAAVAGVWAMLIGACVHRELTVRGLLESLRRTATITAAIFSIIAMATFLSVVLTYTRLPQEIIAYFTAFGVTPLMFWIMVAVICLILGTFVEIVPVFYLTVPVFAAICASLGLDLLNLYVIFVAFAGIGMITPPVCVGIYTSAGVIGEGADQAFREVPTFVALGIVYGLLMIAFPAAATWLPGVLR